MAPSATSSKISSIFDGVFVRKYAKIGFVSAR